MSEVKRYVCTGLREHTPTDYWADKLTIILVDASDYDQLKAENERLETALTTALVVIQKDRKSLDEARELLNKAAMHVRPTCHDLYDELDAWLEANK